MLKVQNYFTYSIVLYIICGIFVSPSSTKRYKGMKNSDKDNLINSNTACKRLGISRNTLYRLIKNGEIKPAIKMPGNNGSYFFRESELLKYQNRYRYESK